jgi:hypothetical protein
VAVGAILWVLKEGHQSEIKGPTGGNSDKDKFDQILNNAKKWLKNLLPGN